MNRLISTYTSLWYTSLNNCNFCTERLFITPCTRFPTLLILIFKIFSWYKVNWFPVQNAFRVPILVPNEKHSSFIMYVCHNGCHNHGSFCALSISHTLIFGSKFGFNFLDLPRELFSKIYCSHYFNFRSLEVTRQPHFHFLRSAESGNCPIRGFREKLLLHFEIRYPFSLLCAIMFRLYYYYISFSNQELVCG